MFESYSLVLWKVEGAFRQDVLKGRQTEVQRIAVNSREDTAERNI